MDTVTKTISPRTERKHHTPVGGWPAACSCLAFSCLSAGILAPVLGLAFILIHAVLDHDTVFSEVGAGLTVIAIPLLLAGSHLLDLWDRYRRDAECGSDKEVLR